MTIRQRPDWQRDIHWGCASCDYVEQRRGCDCRESKWVPKEGDPDLVMYQLLLDEIDAEHNKLHNELRRLAGPVDV